MHKRSKLRDGITAVLSREQGHPTADEIWEIMKGEFPGTGIATVYRNLDQLVRMEQVRKIAVPDGPARYELNDEKHYHVRCTRCGRIEDARLDFDLADFCDFDAVIPGFIVTDYDIVLEGICRECRKKQKEGGRQ